MSQKPVFELSPEAASQLIAETRRALPRRVQAILRQFWLERVTELGLVPTPRDRILGFTSAGAITASQAMWKKYG